MNIRSSFWKDYTLLAMCTFAANILIKPLVWRFAFGTEARARVAFSIVAFAVSFLLSMPFRIGTWLGYCG